MKTKGYLAVTISVLLLLSSIITGCGAGGAAGLADTGNHSLSGKVSDSNGAGLAGVVIALSGSSTNNTTTDQSGNYAFTGLSNGNYTVAPEKTASYTFTPASRSVTVNGQDVYGQDFKGSTGAGTGGSYSISGKIQTVSGAGIPDVAVALTGAGSGSATTDANGNYSLTGVANGTYSVTPSKTGYSFNPNVKEVTVNNGAVVGQDFTGSVAAPGVVYSISGTVKNSSGVGISNVGISLTGGSGNPNATTDLNGNFTFTNLANGPYTLTPSKTGYTFSPPNGSVSVNNANITGINFIGTQAQPTNTYSISGTITTSGVGLSGVNVSLTGPNGANKMTDPFGNYIFTNLANGTYMLTPSMAGYTFSPPSGSVTVNNANVTGVPFIGTQIQQTYSISGNINTSGVGMSGVNVSLSNGANTTTDPFGNYTFTNLEPYGYYTITPFMAAYTFAPPDQYVQMNGYSVAGKDFTGMPFASYSISGTIQLSNGAGLSGVNIVLDGPGGSSAMTDYMGNYTFTNVQPNGYYVVVPNMTGFTFSPLSVGVTVSGTSNFVQPIIATPVSIMYTISGIVLDNTGYGLSGVTVSIAEIGASVVTDASGYYLFYNMVDGGYSYTLTATKDGYTFSPPSMSVYVNYADAYAPDFVGSSAGTGGSGGSANFDDGTLQGWSATGLWHVSSMRSQSALFSAYYGQESNGTFETGGANSGTLTSKPIYIGSNNPSLSFDYFLDNEYSTGGYGIYDNLMVEISIDGGNIWTMLEKLPDTAPNFAYKTYSLSPYAGSTAIVRFNFNTVDAGANAFEGAYLDNIIIISGNGISLNFDDGLQQGSAVTGLWHVSGKRSQSAPYSLYYGQEPTGTFNTGVANSGTVTLPLVTLGFDAPSLSFDYFLDGEGAPGYAGSFDALKVEISINGGASWTMLENLPDNAPNFTYKTYDLSPFAGALAIVRFSFNSGDNYNNDFEGAYVDNIIINAATVSGGY